MGNKSYTDWNHTTKIMPSKKLLHETSSNKHFVTKHSLTDEKLFTMQTMCFKTTISVDQLGTMNKAEGPETLPATITGLTGTESPTAAGMT